MIEMFNKGTTLRISNLKNIVDIKNVERGTVKELFISGCSINSFAFISNFPILEKLVILDCRSEVWNTASGNKNVRILRLHTLRGQKGYIDNIDFLSTFQNVEYLYLNNFYIASFPDVSCLPSLHTVLCSGRKLIDYSTLEYASNLKTFMGWSATDNHRTPAESFIPILKNPSLQEFEYTQMSNVENKKLDEYVQMIRPDITYPIDKAKHGIVDMSKGRNLAKVFF